MINHIAQRENLSLRIVPTTGGSGMAPLVLSGDARIAYSGGTHSAYTDTGAMQVLASVADERLKYYPEAPTLRELGYDVSMHAVRVVAVPKNTPDHHAKQRKPRLRNWRSSTSSPTCPTDSC
ncbi:MAG: tripartite tricarboxylate transporter substrate-binding protein [Natronospirillum sp.]